MEPSSLHDNRAADTLRLQLVDSLVWQGLIHTQAIEAAFRAVPRHLFLPTIPIEEVYRDQAIATKFLSGMAISSSSQPAMMAIMLEQLDLQPGQRVLEIGAGSGYNAALLAYLVGERGHVTTIDIDEDITRAARTHLDAARYDSVRVVLSDGRLGYPEEAPYDRIILTVGASDISPAWWEQLRDNGRLLLPLALRSIIQKSICFTPAGDHLASLSVHDCSFMMLREGAVLPIGTVQVGQDPGILLTIDDTGGIAVETITAWLEGPGHERPTGLSATVTEIWRSLLPWLALHEEGACTLRAEESAATRFNLDWLSSYPGAGATRMTAGLLGQDGLTVLLGPRHPEEVMPDTSSFELAVRGFGPDTMTTQRLMASIGDWHAAGRPVIERLRVRAYHPGTRYLPVDGELLLAKPSTLMVASWD